MGGTPKRMEQFAEYIMKEIGHKIPAGTALHDISQFSYRYSMYKVGPVLCVSVSTNTLAISSNDFLFVYIMERGKTNLANEIFTQTFILQKKKLTIESNYL